MKVRELIEGALVTEGAARGTLPAPRVSVLLPTFRRGDSGLLQRAIDSILDQRLQELELIIIDDASTDSSAQVIAEAMARDPRITLVRHARNIGLPAVSEYEGYMLARGDRIAFAFDDTVFAPDALDRLLRESDAHPDALVIGWVDLHIRSEGLAPARVEPLGRNGNVEDLLATNVIANSGVMAPRTVIETVGLYDPHVSLARLCDYDLWRRAGRRAPLRFVDVRVGDEHGPSTNDSLGATYPLNQWAADDRMRLARDELLRPEVFGEVDVFDLSPFASERTRGTVRSLADGHVSTRPWMRAPAEPPEPGTDVPRVLVLAHEIDASTQLMFEGPRDDARLHVRVIDPRHRSLMELIDCDAVVVSRRLLLSADWVAAARAMGLPVHYALDDNLPLMHERGELGGRGHEFAKDVLLEGLEDVAGMIASTTALAESFREQKLHDTVAVLPISAPTALRTWAAEPERARASEQPIVVGLFIGAHRLDGFRSELLPALRAVAAEDARPLRVLVPAPLARALAPSEITAGLEIEPYPVSRDYFAVLRHLKNAGTSLLIVPESRTPNTPFKTLHPLLSAASLEASILLPGSPPYEKLASTHGVGLVASPGGSAQWADALRRLVSAHREGGGVSAEELSTRFAPETAATAILDALGPIPIGVDPATRTQLLVEWFPRRLARERSATASSTILASGTSPAAGDPFMELFLDLFDTVRSSRRLHAFRPSRGPLERFSPPDQPGERIEISRPLSSSVYQSYRVRLEAGVYHDVTLQVWSAGAPGDLVGVELVSPDGVLLLHEVAELPHVDAPVPVTLDTSGLVIDAPGEHELRIFARTTQPAFVLEAVDRRLFGLRRPMIRPLVAWNWDRRP